MIELHDDADIEALPTGSLITWLVRHHDETSRVAAFVKQETRAVSPEEGRPFDQVTWIVNDAMPRQSIRDARVTYPAHVVVRGQLNLADWTQTSIPAPGSPEQEMLDTMEQLDPPADLCGIQSYTDLQFPIIRGGSWSRETALKAAVVLYGADAPLASLSDVTNTAEAFEEWLNRPEADETDEVEETVADLATDVDPELIHAVRRVVGGLPATRRDREVFGDWIERLDG